MSIRVGQPVQYTNSDGNVRAAVVIATNDSVPAESGVQPSAGYAHLVVWSLSMGPIYRMDVPERTVAESIPDYTVDGRLIGFIQEV